MIKIEADRHASAGFWLKVDVVFDDLRIQSASRSSLE
jgi:hypothetical protein